MMYNLKSLLELNFKIVVYFVFYILRLIGFFYIVFGIFVFELKSLFMSLVGFVKYFYVDLFVVSL